MPAAKDIRDAKAMLEKAGVIKSVRPTQLIAASHAMGKPVREALAAVAEMFAAAEGTS